MKNNANILLHFSAPRLEAYFLISPGTWLYLPHGFVTSCSLRLESLNSLHGCFPYLFQWEFCSYICFVLTLFLTALFKMFTASPLICVQDTFFILIIYLFYSSIWTQKSFVCFVFSPVGVFSVPKQHLALDSCNNWLPLWASLSLWL